MSTTTAHKLDSQLLHTSAVLRQRATSLRSQAASLPSPVGEAYRRRAAELELEAWVAEIQAGVPESELHDVAA
jgi:hypothetical protein